MPPSTLWGVTRQGKVFHLSTRGSHWKPLRQQQGVKRLATVHDLAWAVGSDHHIYIYIPIRDIPIRCKEVTFENQRWNPMEGFSGRLLPTDRPQFSSEDGLENLPKPKFQLPSASWQWETEWTVEDNLEGQPLDPEGWTYAFDFPANFVPSKHWNSMVRRRKWVRYRRFIAMDSWAPIPGIHEDQVKEPFVDVAIGGTEISGMDFGHYCVWGVTILGQIVYRAGVTTWCPEGTGWVPVTVPSGAEVCQVDVGPHGQVWAVCWDGSALVRVGVSRQNPYGTGWMAVSAPNPESQLTQVSVGSNVVWAVCKLSKIWFRKGVQGVNIGTIGTGWVEMVGQMALVSVAPFDQVFALSKDGSFIYYRTGITNQELTGKTWRAITLPRGAKSRRQGSQSSYQSFEEPEHPHITNMKHQVSRESSTASDTIIDFTMECDIVPAGGDSNEVWPEDPTSLAEDNTWVGVSGGSCLLEPLPAHWFAGSFADYEESSPGNSGRPRYEPWRQLIMERLKRNYEKNIKPYLSYPPAIEKGCWVKSVGCRWWSGKRAKWQDATLELETMDTSSGSKGTLALVPLNTSFKKMFYDLDEMEGIIRVMDAGRNVLLIFIKEQRKPVKLHFGSDTILLDWLATLNSSCLNQRSLVGTPDPLSLYVTTLLGDIYVCPPPDNPDNSRLFFLLGGGHFYQVASCCAGLVWALGYNHTPWVYTGGYGGGPYKGISGHNVDIHPVWDTRCIYVYENQRWNPLTGFSARGLPTDRYMWSDQTGRVECIKSDTQLPSINWSWVSEWEVDYKAPGGSDSDGWQYAPDFPLSYHPHKHFTDYVRRRRWLRKCRLSTQGPWLELGSTPLLCMSLYSAPGSAHISAWAVSTNGDVLCRLDVSSDSPEGSCWVHVPTELNCKHISAGGQVWAIGRDGTAFLRQGISQNTPTGQVWFHVEPPPACSLQAAAVGATVVYAIAENRTLWCRQEIVPAFPEGTRWKHVADNVYAATVSHQDELWAICDVPSTPNHKASSRALCRRTGLSQEDQVGSGWEVILTGSCWNQLSIS